MLESSFAAIGRQGERARKLITSLLDLSQLEQGSIKLDLDVVDISEVTSSALCACAPPPPRTVKVESVDFQVRADRVRLEQVFVNLLGNAYRYGGPNVSILGSHQGPYVLVVVSDDGPGVPPELIPRMFEPFARGRDVEGIQGSGLGLAIVRRILEASGGEISYDRRSSSGARFLLRLPQAA
ncbi:MAG: sensor histidine kinase [Actinomycetota bacterium]